MPPQIRGSICDWIKPFPEGIYTTDGKIIFCQPCGKKISCTQKSHLIQHNDSDKLKENFERFQKTVIDSHETEDAASIRISQELFSKQSIEHQLAYIQCNFSILPKAITKLESQGLTLSQNLDVLTEVKSAISNAGGQIGQKIQDKLNFVMQNNPGLSKMTEIAKVQNGEEAELEVGLCNANLS